MYVRLGNTTVVRTLLLPPPSIMRFPETVVRQTADVDVSLTVGTIPTPVAELQFANPVEVVTELQLVLVVPENTDL